MNVPLQPGEVSYSNAPITWRIRWRLAMWLFTHGHAGLACRLVPEHMAAPREER
jgi:hypothetical protein